VIPRPSTNSQLRNRLKSIPVRPEQVEVCPEPSRRGTAAVWCSRHSVAIKYYAPLSGLSIALASFPRLFTTYSEFHLYVSWANSSALQGRDAPAGRLYSASVPRWMHANANRYKRPQPFTHKEESMHGIFSSTLTAAGLVITLGGGLS